MQLRKAIPLSAALIASLAYTTLHAQLYWDTNGATAGLGGSGSWVDGGSNWSTDTGGTTGTTWTNASRNTADFRDTGGAVTVDAGGVAADSLLFNTGGYTLSGGGITLGRATGTTDYTILNYLIGSSANSIGSNILINDSDIASSTIFTINNSSGQNLALSGNVTLNYDSTPTGNSTINFTTGSASSSITLSGQILAGANSGTMRLTFGTGSGPNSSVPTNNGTFQLDGNNSAVTGGSTINGGTVLITHGNALGTGTIGFGSSGARGEMKLLADADITVSNALSMSGASTSTTVVGVTAGHEATFTGTFNMNAFGTNGTPGTISTPDPVLTAGAGGKLNYTGLLSVTASIPRGFIKEGAGIVSLSRAAGNTYRGYTQINEGTLLLMNTSGSATGDASQLAVGEAGVIIAAGAALGGTGISTVKVSASAANSIITAGDMTKAGISAIGTLHLTGGLDAASGLTFNYDIDGASVDVVDFGSSAVSIAGTATFNFTNLGSIETEQDYTLFTGSGDWSSISASFVFNGPNGFTVSSHSFDAANNILTVQFSTAAVPEPDAAAMLAGLAMLAGATLRRRRNAS